jgi:hypothetical protein
MAESYNLAGISKKRLTNPVLCVIVIGRMEELRSFFYAQNFLKQKKGTENTTTII